MRNLIILLSIFFFTLSSFGQDTNLTEEQVYFIENSDRVDTVEAYVTYVGGEEEPMVVIYGDDVRVLFTLEQTQKINNQYRMVELLEEVISKYGLESDIDVGIINSMEEEIYLLRDQLKISESRIENKDMIISSLEKTIAKMEEQNRVNEEINKNLEEQRDNWEKEAKKQKRQKIFVAIGGGILVVLVLIASL